MLASINSHHEGLTKLHSYLELLSTINQFSVPQIEYPLGGISKTGSHVYFLLIVAMILLL